MNCRRVQRRISLFLDDRLSSGERADVAAHLRSCDSCRGSGEEMRGALAALSVIERAEPAEDGWIRLLPLLEQSPRAAKRAGWMAAQPNRSGLAASAAALVVIVAGSVLLLRPVPVDHTSVPAPPPGATVRAPETTVQPAPDAASVRQTADSTAVPAGSQGEVRSMRPETAPGKGRTAAAAASLHGQVASAVRSKRPVPTPKRSIAGLEPDPELVAYAPPASEDSVAEEVADMVSTGLAPLVAAAATEDPLSWITDASAEEWL